MSAVTLAELSRLREADTVESDKLVDAITTELRMALGFVIPKAQLYVESITLEEYGLLRMDTLFLSRRTRLIGIEPLTGNCGIPSIAEVEKFSSPSAVLLPLSDDLFLAPRVGQLVIRDHRVTLKDELVLETISTRRLARGIVNHTWSTGREMSDAIVLLEELVLMPIEGLRQRIRIEMASMEAPAS